MIDRMSGTALLLFGLIFNAQAQVNIIRADAAPLWGNVTLTSVATIGVADGPPEYIFGHILFLVGEKNGSVFVYDATLNQINRYSAQGKFLNKIGRKGSGPGEYVSINGLAVVGDTALLTWDPRNARLTYYSFDGKIKNTVRVTTTSNVYGANVFGVDNAGIVSIQVSLGETTRYLRIRPNGAVLDTLTAIIPKQAPGMVLMTDEGERWNFQDRKLSMPSPTGGMLWASSDTLGFTRTVAGKRQTVIRKATAVSLADEEKKEWEAYAEYSYNRRKAAPPQPNVRAPEPELSKIPSVKPLLRTMFADQDGRVWLDAYGPAEKRQLPARPATETRPRISMVEKTNYDLFNLAGQYLGRLTMPPHHELYAASGDYVWTVTTGPDDEDRIDVFTITRRK